MARKEYYKEYRKNNSEKLAAYLRQYRANKKNEVDFSVYENHRKPWEDEDLEYLEEWYPTVGAIQMSYELGRTPESIRTKYYEVAKQLGGVRYGNV